MSIRPEQIAEAGATQQAAASDENHAVRVVAGPGTGKSRTIEDRVAWLLSRGMEGQRIAAVSFTRASTHDLRARVEQACDGAGYGGTRVRVTTLHALALRALRAAGALAAYPVDPNVLDDWEQESLFDAEFGQEAGIGSVPRRREIRVDHETFWSTGQYGQPPAQDAPVPPITEQERNRFRRFHGPRTQLYACVLPGEIIQRCVERIEAGLLDPLELLEIEHLIVDEFQDLNPMDLRFIYALAEQGATLFAAGDDDQSLYAFRYANPEGIQHFTQRFQPVGDHVLQHCFRCTPEVLNAAGTLITAFPAPNRIPKTPVSLYEASDPPVDGGFGRWQFDDAADEAHAIAQSCRRLIDAGLRPREIMILLSNARSLTWQIRDALNQFVVPFEPPRTSPFKNIPMGRAILTLLRIASHPDDYVALRTLITLLRGVGVGTAARIANVAIDEHLNYRDLFYVPLPEGLFTPAAERALLRARDVCAELLAWGPEDLFDEAHADDLDRMLRMVFDDEPDGDWRSEVEALPEGTLLHEVAAFLSTDKDDDRWDVLRAIYERLGEEIEREGVLPERVRMMTMHGSKGLSATVVFIPGLEEEVLPGPRRGRSPGQVLEAARMLYVAITRARAACVVSYATSRFINGQVAAHTPSRYAPHLGGAFGPGGCWPNCGSGRRGRRSNSPALDHLPLSVAGTARRTRPAESEPLARP
jgi:ATP-dependent DNA helicase UvrD/PcrA